MRIGPEQRRARLAVRHRLATPATSVEEAARSVVVVHATDPASVHLSLRARTAGVTTADVERALYADRSLVRLLGMRRTMFVVPRDIVPVVQASSTDAVAATMRQRYAKLLAEAGVGDAEWLDQACDEAAAAIAALGCATGAQVSKAVARLQATFTIAEGKRYEARISPTTWVLALLGAQGRLVRGRPRGSWVSSTYEWWAPAAWLGEEPERVPAAEARVELVRRWLAAFGPGTVTDLRWWTGWTARDVSAALASVDPVEVDLGGSTGIVLPDDLDPTPGPPLHVALLPALDATTMGWQERSWYLGPHVPALFDRNGNAGPTVWAGGRVVGGWGQRPNGEVVVRLLEDVGAETAAATETEAAALTAWLAGVRVTPRFRTPLERELSA